ncbi:hypothetical protein QOZ80_9AG0687500 [Eleusine coracana subsp. coracana]|nr:hypothetical protein QOZ80_9AG0687500 [Eleusine coracana subsp. coracana]
MDKMEEGNVETQPHAKAEYKLPNPIIGKVPGTTEIVLVESISRHVGRFQNALPFYKGKVRCGDDELAFTEAAVLAFQIHEGGRVLSLHHCLSLFQHPCLMNSLGYGYGTGEHEGFVFLAFPWFQSTFMDFMDKSCKNTVDLERFSEDFIRLVTCIVYGLIELHSYNYYCPNLSGKQILVLKEHNSVFAKLWGFCPLELGNEKGKDMDWVRLGQILRKTAKNHKSYTIEIADLCERMMQGTLKGIHILKHAALLSVRFKFDNILALNIFALAHFTKSNETPDKANLHCSASDQDNTVAMNEFFCESSDKNKTIAAFKILLDSDVGV